ncbi:hypothetical protein [Haloquadratum walsbyi]|nr:hypothetical protein [Haloquadratum walsbyi]
MTAPGPDAEHAFRLGTIAGALVGIAVIAVVYLQRKQPECLGALILM